MMPKPDPIDPATLAYAYELFECEGYVNDENARLGAYVFKNRSDECKAGFRS